MFDNIWVGSENFRLAFARLKPYWGGLEVPRGCCIGLSPVFSYLIGEHCDPESPWWVVAYTGLAANTSVFIMFEVYDICLLGALRKYLIKGIRRLNLETILGNASNARVCLSLLQVI